MAGLLYVVATPLGNLDDITLRAVKTLQSVDAIACEDTRTSIKLLQHLAIEKPLLSYHDHNEGARAAELVSRMQAGENVALISDAGTPLISDPGYRLVAQAVAAGITVVPIPGPCAFVGALSASGLPSDAVLFVGFLSPKSSQRKKELEAVREVEATLALYEAPHRIVELLDDVGEVYGEVSVVVVREMTKLHEEILRGTAVEVANALRARATVRGEITVLLGRRPLRASTLALADQVLEKMAEGWAEMDAIKEVARSSGTGKREVYRQYLEKKRPR